MRKQSVIVSSKIGGVNTPWPMRVVVDIPDQDGSWDISYKLSPVISEVIKLKGVAYVENLLTNAIVSPQKQAVKNDLEMRLESLCYPVANAKNPKGLFEAMRPKAGDKIGDINTRRRTFLFRYATPDMLFQVVEDYGALSQAAAYDADASVANPEGTTDGTEETLPA